MYSAYSKAPVVNGGLGVRKSLKDIASRRARRKRQKAEYRRQKTGDRRGFEGWRCSKKSEKKGFEESRIQGVKWRKTED